MSRKLHVSFAEIFKSELLKWIKVLFYVSLTITQKILQRGRKFMGQGNGRAPTWAEDNVVGKVVVVTGANKGIGKEVTFELAKRRATVVMACRNLEAAKRALVDIRNRTFSGTLVPMRVDLASFTSIRHFVEELKSKYGKVDILVNNAGLMVPDKYNLETSDGYEMNIGVNYLGTFYLTNALLDLLKRSSSARIVNVTSLTLRQAKLDYNEPLKDVPSISSFRRYSRSKLALAYFTRELARRTEGTSIKTYGMCPGIVATDVDRYITNTYVLRKLKFIQRIIFSSPNKGAQTVVYCACAKELENQSGELYRCCRKWTDRPLVFPEDLIIRANLPILRDEDCRALWTATEKILHIQ